MAARSESARRVSDCVTALLRDQPFFGSLALRLPIRPDENRETLASDGKDIRYAPQWVADTDADRIKTALARVVLSCALKHHTRRGGRDPERWQLRRCAGPSARPLRRQPSHTGSSNDLRKQYRPRKRCRL